MINKEFIECTNINNELEDVTRIVKICLENKSVIYTPAATTEELKIVETGNYTKKNLEALANFIGSNVNCLNLKYKHFHDWKIIIDMGISMVLAKKYLSIVVFKI